MSIQGIPVREHVATVCVANGVPYERLRLPCHHESLPILEASEQAFSTWPTKTPHVRSATAIGSVASSSISIGSFSLTTGVHTRL